MLLGWGPWALLQTPCGAAQIWLWIGAGLGFPAGNSSLCPLARKHQDAPVQMHLPAENDPPVITLRVREDLSKPVPSTGDRELNSWWTWGGQTDKNSPWIASKKWMMMILALNALFFFLSKHYTNINLINLSPEARAAVMCFAWWPVQVLIFYWAISFQTKSLRPVLWSILVFVPWLSPFLSMTLSNSNWSLIVSELLCHREFASVW